MVDRGGLNYPIRVEDQFSKTTALFRKEMRQSKAAFRDFQNELKSQRGASRSLRDTAQAARALAAAQRDQARATRDTTKPLTEAEKAKKRDVAASKQQAAASREVASAKKLEAQIEKTLAREEARALRDQQRAIAAGFKAQAQREKTTAQIFKQQKADKILGQERVKQNIENIRRIEQERLALKRAHEVERKEIEKTQQTRQREQERQQRDAQRRDAQFARTVERERADRQKASEREQRDRERADPRFQAEQRINRELFQRKVLLEQISLLQARSRTLFAQGDFAGARDASKRVGELKRELNGTDTAARRLLFTFRRLVGALAIFTLARRAVQVFRDLVAGGVKFNDTIEVSTIGVAGLITALTDVRDATGQSVSTADELAASLGLAREQIQLLRQDSLRTTATFTQLLDTFQIATAPGFAAGLDLDQIRQFTVQISQAATAIGLSQNQLAEEIRSILSGTIQARTTRIAVALGITNADIRRLKETGQLFEFLQKRFEGFNEAAQRAARQTLSGITQLVRGAFQELLGKAAQPLFEELLDLGNELFDNVITIVDEAGNIRPNPKAVAAFQALFQSITDGIQKVRKIGEEIGFSGLQDIVDAIAAGISTALQFALGFVEVFLAEFNLIAQAVRAVSDALGLSVRWLGRMAALTGQILAATITYRQVTKLLNTDWKGIVANAKKLGPIMQKLVAPALLIAAAFLAVGKGIELILQSIFEVDLSLRDTVQLVVLGLLGAFLKVGEIVAIIGETITTSLVNALDKVIATARDKARGARIFIASLFGDNETAQRLARERNDEELRAQQRIANRRKRLELEIADIRAQSAARQKGIEEEIASIIGEAAGRSAKGSGFDLEFDAAKAAEEAAAAAAKFLSTADKPIGELGEKLEEVNKAIRQSRLEFEQAAASRGAEGFGGQVEDFFGQQQIENAERLVVIRRELQSTEERIAALRQAGVADSEGQLVTLLRDEKDLRDAINVAIALGNELALSRAATEAASLIPQLARENAMLNAQAASERAITAAIVNNAGARQQAIAAAQGAVDSAQTELEITRQQSAIELDLLRQRVQNAAPGRERAVLQTALNQLTRRKQLEEEILELKIRQLKEEQRLAQLAETGSFGQGVREGLSQLRDELPTVFEVALEQTKQFVTGFANFLATQIVQSIVNAEQEGVDETELLKQAAGRFAQQVATQLLEAVIQNVIGLLLNEALTKTAVEVSAAETAAGIRLTAAHQAAAVEISAAETAAAIRAASSAGGVGGHTGGLVPGGLTPAGFHDGGAVGAALKAMAHAKGYHRGGRPRGLHPADTVNAWLEPGEFVVRRSAVQALGLDTMRAINQGRFPVARGSNGSLGMQSGGEVPDRSADAVSGRPETQTVVVPAIVARDRELDQLTAGGRNAFMRFMRENAGNVKAILDREGT